MRPCFVLLATAGLAAACSDNNCARAVTGTRDKDPPLASRRADCSRFLLATVTPATVTVTTTVATITLTTTTSRTLGPVAARQVTVVPTGKPTYASACPDDAAYRSACSCWGILPATTTLAPPQAVVTVTATVTATRVEEICVVPGRPCDFNDPGACCSRTCCRDDVNGGSPKCGVGILDCSNVQPRKKRDGLDQAETRVAALLPDGSISVQ